MTWYRAKNNTTGPPAVPSVWGASPNGSAEFDGSDHVFGSALAFVAALALALGSLTLVIVIILGGWVPAIVSAVLVMCGVGLAAVMV